MGRIYLDWAATAPPIPDIAETAANIALDTYGNPSSAHAEGRAALKLLEDSRRRLAEALGLPPKGIIFTSGGTESNNIVLSSLLAHGGGEIIVSGIEHASVHEPAEYLASIGYRVNWIAAGPDGIIDPAKVESALSDQTLLVAVMHVNNETGAVQPIGEIARVVRDYERSRRSGRRIHVHCDAVQALGKIETAYADADIDSVTVSGHKIGGLRGAGALYLRRPLSVVFRGGGQESNLRPGTENLSAIWALAEAASRRADSLGEHLERAAALRSRLVEGIAAIAGSCFLPGDSARGGEGFSPYILSAAFPPLPGEVLVRTLNDAGCSVSMGSACSSKRTKERRVLANMGIDPETARSAIRISTGVDTTEQEVDRFLEILRKEVERWSTALRV